MLLTQTQTAEKVGYKICQFTKVIKHQKNFPKPFLAHAKANPKWRESDIDNYLSQA
ncbi:MAG: hypothetical protein NTW57_06670 [Methylophilales bacterium]|nr:hypothetical protein [Methylophilales bacterium]